MSDPADRQASTTAPSPSEAIRVLHLDDEPGFSELVQISLERASDHLTVQTALTPEDALAVFATESIDCFVCDYDLPGMTGLEVLTTVRETDPDLPFILFTGKGSEEIASEAITAGVTDYLQKQIGSDQYTVLANRIQNAVMARRSAENAVRHERIASVIREVNRGLVRARNRQAIDTTVCTALADAEPYLFAWIGEYDPEAEEIVPRYHAGMEAGYLESIEIPVAASGETDGPTARAFRTGEIQVMQDIAEDPQYEPWRADALERGYQSSAAVPLAYEGRTYGILNVYADQASAFGETEQAVLQELGSDVAHAIYAVDLQGTFRRFRQAVDHAGHAVYMTDDACRIQTVNPAFERITGYDEASVVGREPNFLYDDATGFQTVCETVLAGTVWEDDLEAVTAAGDEIHLSGTIAPIIGADEAIEGLVAVHADVTDRAERERALIRTKTRLQHALEGTRAAIWEYDVASDTITRHESARSLWGTTASDPIPLETAVSERVHPADGNRIHTALERTVTEGDSYRVEFRLNVQDEWIWVESQGELHRTGPDDPGRVIGLITDITDRRSREAELVRYETILEASGDAVYTLDATGHLTFVNDAFCDLVGYTEQELLEEYVDLLMDETDIQRGERLIRELLMTDGTRGTFEMDLITADGRSITVENHVAVLPSEDGFRGTTGIHRVITDRKRREQELTRQNQRLEQFASVLSHDLRSPLGVTRGYLEVLEEAIRTRQEAPEDDPVDETVVRAIERAVTATERMNEIIEDVLSLAREGQSVEEPERIGLGDLSRRAWRTVSTAGATLQVPEGTVIAADERRLQRVLENLFRNAIEHAGPEVSVTVTPLADGFAVTDDGPGISDDMAQTVFESGVTTSGGTGFGLAIVREIAAAHGWSVTAETAPDGGTIISFTGVERIEPDGAVPN